MTLQSDLRASMSEEKMAARRYRSRARKADQVTAELYKHIAHEEDVHYREFKERLELKVGK